MWRYMEVYGGIWSTWRYMEEYGGIWRLSELHRNPWSLGGGEGLGNSYTAPETLKDNGFGSVMLLLDMPQ
jgi:hypothetical protein